MEEHPDRIEALMQKLELLIQQQAAFSKDIETLKTEIYHLRPAAEIPQTNPVEEIKTVKPETAPELEQHWPDLVDLSFIKSEVNEFEEGVTGAGKAFIKFNVSCLGITYDVLFAANGNWIVQDKSKNLIAKGRHRANGKTVLVTQGTNAGKTFSIDRVIDCIIQAADLNKPASTLERPVSETLVSTVPTPPKTKSSVEKFVGENLIAVIAVIILLIGVVFGVKYSIDHNLISPLTRIILSYVLGIGILASGIRLKKKYELFSAILVSGSMAIMYFVTFIAYSLYGLIPQMASFAVMTLFTVFTVFAALHYKRQIIAHLALVASYAIPFLLSDGSGNVKALFIYMTIVNAGILVIAFKKHWKPLYYVAFGCTWLIYGLWYADGYRQFEHFSLALTFGILFFILFYITFLAYKLIEKEKFAAEDIILIVLNSTIYYGISYNILDGHETGSHYLGLFTLLTALVHFVVSVLIFKSKLADRNLFYLSSGMVLAFLTMAVPVQLDGTWVTLLWGAEAAVLFSIGRINKVPAFEFLSYPVMFIALISLGHDWSDAYTIKWWKTKTLPTPFFNVTFLTSLIVCASFGIILYINNLKQRRLLMEEKYPNLLKTVSVAVSVVFILVLYTVFRLEIDAYWDKLYRASVIKLDLSSSEYIWPETHHNQAIRDYGTISSIIYSLLFILLLSVINQKKIRNTALGITTMISGALAVIIFLSVGLYTLSSLREYYLYQNETDSLYSYGRIAILLRYVTYIFAGAALYALHMNKREAYIPTVVKHMIELFIHSTILWVLCSELINLLDLAGSHAQHKLGLSILCGLYAFLLVGLGIWRRKQFLRISAFVLFGLTLVKLFFYDIAHLTTIAKTIVFISLGLILLVISFMYNKYAKSISDEKK